MKFVFVFLVIAVFGSALAAPRTYNLHEDLHDFIELIPKDEIQDIIITYITQDEEVYGLLVYLESDKFKDFILQSEAIEEYRAFLKYLQDNGVDVYDFLDKLHLLLGLPPFEPSKVRKVPNGKGVRGMVDEIEAILPFDKIEALYYEKLETSSDFQNLIKMMSSDDFKNVVTEVRQNPEFQIIIADAKSYGLDVELFAQLLNKIFGWGLQIY